MKVHPLNLYFRYIHLVTRDWRDRYNKSLIFAAFKPKKEKIADIFGIDYT